MRYREKFKMAAPNKSLNKDTP